MVPKFDALLMPTLTFIRPDQVNLVSPAASVTGKVNIANIRKLILMLDEEIKYIHTVPSHLVTMEVI